MFLQAYPPLYYKDYAENYLPLGLVSRVFRIFGPSRFITHENCDIELTDIDSYPAQYWKPYENLVTSGIRSLNGRDAEEGVSEAKDRYDRITNLAEVQGLFGSSWTSFVFNHNAGGLSDEKWIENFETLLYAKPPVRRSRLVSAAANCFSMLAWRVPCGNANIELYRALLSEFKGSDSRRKERFDDDSFVSWFLAERVMFYVKAPRLNQFDVLVGAAGRIF